MGFFNWARGILQRKADPTYQVEAQFFSPGAPIWSNKDYRTYVSQGYRRCGTVYNCVNKISGAASGIKWKLYTDRSMSREITSHPLLDLWNKPNPRMGASSFVEQCFGHWHLSGNAYLYASRPSPGAPPVELWPLRPDLIKIVAGEKEVAGYVYGWGTSRAQDFDVDQIMHLKFPAYDDDFYGLSPVEVAMQLVDQQNEGNSWNTALMQNAGKPASVFFSKGYLTLEQRTQVRQELLKRYSGKRNAGMPMVLEADMTWQSMSMSPYELDWLQSRELNTREIAAIFDVAPELVGDSAGKTFANQKEAKQSLYTENVLPKLDRFDGYLNVWLVPMFADLAASGAWFTYDRSDIEVLAELYTAQQQALSEQANSMWNSGQCSLRVAQRLQGLPARPKVYLDVYKFGAILVREEDLEAYAMQALQKPAAPPSPVPEPLLNQPSSLPQLPAPKPAARTTVTEVPNDEQQNDQNPDGGAAPATGKEKRSHAAPEYKLLDLATREAKEAYAKQVEADRQAWEEKIEARFQAYFRAEQKAVVAAIRAASIESEAADGIENAISGLKDDLQQQLYNCWYDVGRDFGGRAQAQFAEASKASESAYSRKTTPDLAALFTAQTIAYLLNLAGTKVQQISGTTLTDLRQALATGVAAGESIPELAKRIDQLYLTQIIPNRSTNIAQSEVCAASNWASHQAASQSGLTLNKVWLATEDSRTWPDHADADGQKVALDQPFTVGGEQMMFPGDSSMGASAKEICRCRCTQYYERADATTGTQDEERDGEAGDEKVIRLIPRRSYRSVREFMEAMA
ncbi:MAG TPA: phage portal protein [Ktedonobacteraceae bacterium]|nr:phage portal protein [Ktedonobacteraceae bacterium]